MESVNAPIIHHFWKTYVEEASLPWKGTNVDISKDSCEFIPIYANTFIKVENLGKTKKGNTKWLVAMKNTFRSSSMMKTMQYMVGITKPNSTTLLAFEKIHITISPRNPVIVINEIVKPNQGVYLMQSYFGNQSYFKIGKGTDVFNRIKGMKTANPDVILLGYLNVVDIDKLEKDLHEKFNHLRYKLEWFVDHHSVLNYYESHPNFIDLR